METNPAERPSGREGGPMRIIISPAKQMREDLDSLPPQGLPDFLPETRRLLTALQALSPGELQALWK